VNELRFPLISASGGGGDGVGRASSTSKPSRRRQRVVEAAMSLAAATAPGAIYEYGSKECYPVIVTTM